MAHSDAREQPSLPKPAKHVATGALRLEFGPAENSVMSFYAEPVLTSALQKEQMR